MILFLFLMSMAQPEFESINFKDPSSIQDERIVTINFDTYSPNEIGAPRAGDKYVTRYRLTDYEEGERFDLELTSVRSGSCNFKSTVWRTANRSFYRLDAYEKDGVFFTGHYLVPQTDHFSLSVGSGGGGSFSFFGFGAGRSSSKGGLNSRTEATELFRYEITYNGVGIDTCDVVIKREKMEDFDEMYGLAQFLLKSSAESEQPYASQSCDVSGTNPFLQCN